MFRGQRQQLREGTGSVKQVKSINKATAGCAKRASSARPAAAGTAFIRTCGHVHRERRGGGKSDQDKCAQVWVWARLVRREQCVRVPWAALCLAELQAHFNTLAHSCDFCTLPSCAFTHLPLSQSFQPGHAHTHLIKRV